MNETPVLVSMGHYHPPFELKNNFFESLGIESSADWVEDRTGIKSRFSIVPPDDLIRIKNGDVSLKELQNREGWIRIQDMSQASWDMLCSRWQATSGSLPPEVETVLCGSSIPDAYDFPAAACVIASHLNLNAAAFDVNSACSSFVVNLHVARHLFMNPLQKGVAIFTPERYTTRLNFNDRKTCVLFGDGAAAAFLTKPSLLPKGTKGFRVVDTQVWSDPSGYEHVVLPTDDFFDQNGPAVQKFAITKTVSAAREIMERNRLVPDDIHYFIGHQANLRMLKSSVKKIGIREEGHLYNVDHYGNQGAAGAPAVLSMHWEKFQPGDLVLVCVVGAGLTWAGALLEYVG